MNKGNGKPANFVGDSDRNSRSPRDFYPTDPRAVEALLNVEEFETNIWEPACGDGAISKTLLSRYNSIGTVRVFSSDIYNYGFPGMTVRDFFYTDHSLVKNAGIKTIVTNPPYLIKHSELGRVAVEQWVEHAHNIGIKKSAWLLKTVAIAGKARSKIFQECGLSKVYQFRGRLDMMHPDKPNGKSMMDHAWFIFDHTRTEYKNPEIEWIEL